MKRKSKLLCLILTLCLLLPLLCGAAQATPQTAEYTVCLGGGHSALLEADGTLYTWGENKYGQLGDGTQRDRTVPQAVLTEVCAVSLGGEHSAAITRDGTLYTWGRNNRGQLGDGKRQSVSIPQAVLTDVRAVSLGTNHTAAITGDGSLYVWGSNDYGQVGNGMKTDQVEPVKVLEDVAQVSLGAYHSAAVTSQGKLYVWGRNHKYQLGDGTLYTHTEPMELLQEVSQVSLGVNHSAALLTDGSLYLWGSNDNGEQGSGLLMPGKTPALLMKDVQAVSLGGAVETVVNSISNTSSTNVYGHSAALTKDGTLYVWGANQYFQVGNKKSADVRKPAAILEDVVSMALGGGHSAAITRDGTLYTWGRNNRGQLGDGQAKNVNAPKAVLIVPQVNPLADVPDDAVPQVNPFADVPDDAAYAQAVLALYKQKIMNGTGEGQFAPALSLNRATAVTVLWRAAGWPEPATGDCGFSDVGESWYTAAICWASESGIVQGMGDGSFGVDESLTNEQLALIMARFAAYQGKDTTVSQQQLDSYSGLNIHSWALTETVWALVNGLLTLPEDLPTQPATRATVARAVYSFLD